MRLALPAALQQLARGGRVRPPLPALFVAGCRRARVPPRRLYGSGAAVSDFQRSSATLEGLTVLDILKHAGHGGVKYVLETERVMDAMRTMVEGKVGSLVVKSEGGKLVGFVTQRDCVRCIVRRGSTSADSGLFGGGEPTGWNDEVRTIMTPSRELIFLSPKDTLDDARALMSVAGKRQIPVLSGNTLLGVVSPKDIAKALHMERSVELTAKASYVTHVIPHKGIPTATKVAETHDGNLLPSEQYLALSSAVANLPHPHKESLGEDSFLLGPHMVGVADGVGSWWEMGVDPANYARALMHAACESCVGFKQERREIFRKPHQVLYEAWHRVSATGTVGASTACLVSLHPIKQELLAANVGDSGFLLLRKFGGSGADGALLPGDAGSGALGTLDTYGATPAGGGRAGGGGLGHHVAFRSPQQLRAFNAPFQLGTAPDRPPDDDSHDDRFETPHDAALVRVPVRQGDVVVLATDGLFDNMPEADVLQIVDEYADEREEVLARKLATRAQELSLDHTVDSPFAVLAKDNDILWGGGRPDDITVVVSRVVDTRTEAPPDGFPAFTGPGPSPELAPKPAKPSAGGRAEDEAGFADESFP